MKRLIRSKTIFEYEWDIDICPQTSSIASSTILDTRSNEYQSFIEGLIDNFETYGYELYNDPEYTHRSNFGSDSWYYTFLKVEDYVEIRIVVNVRISDHDNVDRLHRTAAQRRSSYVNKIGDELADEFKTNPKPLKVPINIVFNDNNFTSYTQALFAVHDQLEDIEKDYADWRKSNGLTNKTQKGI